MNLGRIFFTKRLADPESLDGEETKDALSAEVTFDHITDRNSSSKRI
jgi:hypothetical protein